MHAIVSGAGVAGLALAGRLARDGWTVEVIERAPAPRASGYLIDFFGPGYDAAERLGVLTALRSRAESFDELRSVDAAGSVRATVPIRLVGTALGGTYLTILRPRVVEALHAELPEPVRIRWGVQLETVHGDGERVHALLSDGERLEADLLVGADGVRSRVRQLAWGGHERFLRPIEALTFVAWLGEDAALAADLDGKVAMQTELARLQLEAQRAVLRAAALPGIAHLVARAAGGVTKR